VKYELVYTARAVRDIENLDENVKQRIGKTIIRYKENPLEYAEKLTDSTLGTYRFRIGDYRVIFDIEGRDVIILRIGHRKEIYRRK
jgi:mRNA interferase RelE/StbE